MYIQLCRRWKTYNRVIFIQTCRKDSPSAALVQSIPNNNDMHSEPLHAPSSSPESTPAVMVSSPSHDSGGLAIFKKQSASTVNDSGTVTIVMPSYPQNSAGNASDSAPVAV